MTHVSTFRAVCEAVRFPLDDADGARALDRRHLPDYVARVRADSLRVGPTTAPAIWRTIERVVERLDLPIEPEVYVRADPTLNAFVPVIASDARPIVVLHSGLVQLLNASELAFAIGHELGHLGLGHAHLTEVDADNELDALKERSRQRYSELSADRVGLVACASTAIATTVMVKTASGLPEELLSFDPAAFIAQIERDAAERSRSWELHLTHPTLPFRLWALSRFAATEEYHRLVGGSPHGSPLVEVDAEIGAALDRMGDGRLGRLEEDAVDSALTWAGARIVLDDGIVEDHERAELRELVGPVRAGKVLDFAAAQGLEAVTTKLVEALERLRSVGSVGQQRFEASLDAFVAALRVTEDGRGASLIRRILQDVPR